MEEIRLNTIDEAIADFREGTFVIVVDDEDRENEGDFIISAEKILLRRSVAPNWNWICRLLQILLFMRHRLL